jgi:hypothetical protein
MKYKFQIGDLVTFQRPYMSIHEWERSEEPFYLTGMVVHREKAGYTVKENDYQSHYYHVLLASGKTYPMQREDRISLLAKANP